MITVMFLILIMVIFLLDSMALVAWQVSVAILAFVTVAALVRLILIAISAPEGYEDEAGFHYGAKR